MPKQITQLAALGICLCLVACGGGSGGGSGSSSYSSGASSSSTSSSAASSSASVSSPPDWTMFQGDASHTGYVDATFDAANFTKAWDWTMPPLAGADLNPVVSASGVVYADNTLGGLYAIDATSGTTKWSYDIKANIASDGTVDSVSPPAIDNGMLYIPAYITFSSTPGSAEREGAVLASRISDGTVTRFYRLASQGGISQAPTIRNGMVYYVAGEYGGQIYAMSETAAIDSYGEAQLSWTSDSGFTNLNNFESVSVDANGVYFYTGKTLNGYDVSAGAALFSISNPNDQPDWLDAMANNTPFLGSMSDAISFIRSPYVNKDNGYPDRQGGKNIGSFNIIDHTLNWVTQAQYGVTPAIANGIIFAAERGPDVAQLDALSEKDGHVLWSWTPPVTDTVFLNNIVVCRNLAFVGTDKATYAIDLATHQSVWSYPATGALALSTQGVLYIETQTVNSSSAFESNGHLIAIRLHN